MTVSKYFSHISNTKEQDLIEDVTVEIIQQRGLDLTYTPREATENPDLLFGEDPDNKFIKGVVVEMMPETLHGFDGEGDFMAGFGLDVRDEATFIMVKSRFADTVTKKYPHITRPREGDIISYFNTAFEISFVEHERPFYVLGKSNQYKMNCKLFEFSHEEFIDPDSNIDDIPTFTDVSDNNIIQTESDDIVDFSEKDPFSENIF